jgi:hypothetical protein
MRIIKAKNTKTAQSVDIGRKRFRAVINIDIWVPDTGDKEQNKATALEEIHNITRDMSQQTEYPSKYSIGDIVPHNEF